MGNWGDKPFKTLSKSECIEILSTYNINRLELCQIKNINPVTETLCKLAFFATQTCEKSLVDKGQPSAKRRKKQVIKTWYLRLKEDLTKKERA